MSGRTPESNGDTIKKNIFKKLCVLLLNNSESIEVFSSSDICSV